MSDIIYEQPLNERMRTLLRLEHLFAQTAFHLEGDTHWDNRRAVASMIDILNLLERADLKTELIKELDRISASLIKLKQQPGVDESRLDETLSEINTHIRHLQTMAGRLGDSLRANELVSAVKQRLAIPGGSCSFDLPIYHSWLAQSPYVRQQQLNQWASCFDAIEDVVSLLLNLIRQSAYFEEANAIEGYYQKTLESQVPCQLVRVTVKDAELFPEISGGKHRISIRFLQRDEDLKASQTHDTVPFTIGCCVL